MYKKKWKRPKLIVISRRKPEEAVLLGCKGAGGGPGNADNACNFLALAECLNSCYEFDMS